MFKNLNFENANNKNANEVFDIKFKVCMNKCFCYVKLNFQLSVEHKNLECNY